MSTEHAMTAEQYKRALARFPFKAFGCEVEARARMEPPDQLVRSRLANTIGIGDYLRHKDAVAAGTTYQVAPPPTTEATFAEWEAFRVLGRLRAFGAPTVPFLIPTSTSTGDLAFGWTGEGLAAPAVEMTFSPDDALPVLTLSGIVVVTKDLIRRQTPTAQEFLYQTIGQKYGAFLDRQLLDPTLAAVPGTNPASLTNAATPLSSAGTSVADMVTDHRALVSKMAGQHGHLERVVAIMSTKNALALKGSGHMAFAGLTRDGGDYAGIPAICSDSAGTVIALVDAARIVFADDGQGDLELSEQADIEMNTAPTQDATAGTGATLASLWQSRLVGLRIRRVINWRLAESTAVQYLTADYAPAGSPA